jgi:hypothetical protein
VEEAYYQNDEDEDVEHPELRRRITPDMGHLVPLAGLRCLTLANLCGDLSQWNPDIISVLKASPLLQELSLSVEGGNGPFDINDDDDLSWERPSLVSFQNLCLEYAENGWSPLRLRKLCLGWGVILARDNLEHHLNDDTTNIILTESYLELLTDLSCLEDVHINNLRGGWYEKLYAWWSFSEDRTPNLRRLSALQCTDMFSEFIEGLSPGYTEQLTVSFERYRKEGLGPDKRLSPTANYFREYATLPKKPFPFRMFEQNLPPVLGSSRHLPEHENLPDDEEKNTAVRDWATRWSLLTGLYLRIYAKHETLHVSLLDILFRALSQVKNLKELLIGGPEVTMVRLGNSVSAEEGLERGLLPIARKISTTVPTLRYI